MTDRRLEKRVHLSPETLAALTEGSEPDRTGWAIVDRHLSQCRHCLAVYAEFVRARAGLAIDPRGECPPGDLIEIGMRIPAAARTKRARARRLQVVQAMPAIAAGVALALGSWSGSRPAVDPRLRGSISQRLCEDSQALVYAADLLPRERGTRGLGEGAAGDDLKLLVSVFSSGSASPEVAYWLVAGLMASNRLRDADPYLREAIDRFPADARFRNLAAIQAYKNSDLARAEAELRSALSIERGPVQLLNLARVLQEEHRPEEALALRAEARARFPEAPIVAAALVDDRRR